MTKHFELSQEQYETLSRLADTASVSVTFTNFGNHSTLDELVELGLLQDVSKAYQETLQQFRSTAGDMGRVFMLTENALRMFFPSENTRVN